MGSNLRLSQRCQMCDRAYNCGHEAELSTVSVYNTVNLEVDQQAEVALQKVKKQVSDLQVMSYRKLLKKCLTKIIYKSPFRHQFAHDIFSLWMVSQLHIKVIWAHEAIWSVVSSPYQFFCGNFSNRSGIMEGQRRSYMRTEVLKLLKNSEYFFLTHKT